MDFNDTIEEIEEKRKIKIERLEKQGWILIGELEAKGRFCFPTDTPEPWFLYVRYCEDGRYCYDIATGLLHIGHFDYFYLPRRFSINTILCMYISQDKDYGRLSDGSHVVTKADGQKIRLVGYKDWIEVDNEFLEGKIALDELELKFRTNKENLWLKRGKKSKYIQDETSQKLLENYKIIT